MPPVLNKSLNWLVVLLVAIPLGLECYQLYDGISTGVTTSFSKYGGHKSYAIAQDQGRYWFTMACHSVVTVVLAGALWVAVWLARND